MVRGLLLVSSIAGSLLWASAGDAQDVIAETEAAPEPGALALDAHRGDDGHGVVVEARVDATARLSLRIVCRDGDRLVASDEGLSPSLSLRLQDDGATFNAACDAEARNSAGDIVLATTRSVTSAAAARDEAGPATWPFWIAGAASVAAALAIVIAVAVATTTAPVDIGAPTVDGW